jgi:hypothetical protein
MKADLLNDICETCEVRLDESEVPQGSSKTPVGSRIGHEITQSSRQLCLSVNMSGTRLSISHPNPLQDIKGILSLVKKKARLERLNNNTQEMVKLAKILHSELLLQRGDNVLKQLRTGGYQNNVINIEQ